MKKNIFSSILNCERLNVFSQDQEQCKGVHSQHFRSIIVKFLYSTIRPEKEMEVDQIGKKEVKLFICRRQDYLYRNFYRVFKTTRTNK